MIPPPPLAALAVAQICDAITGDPDWLYRRLPHPVVLIGRLIAALDKAWNRPEFSDNARLVRGGFCVTVLVCVCGAVGMIIQAVTQLYTYGWVIDGVLMSVLIAQRSLYTHVRNVLTALTNDGLEAGRVAVGRIVGRDISTLDESGVSRGAIESLAENFSDGVVAPIFWGAVFGLPGMLAYKALNTADSMIGYRTEKYLHFGRLAARLDDAANFVPARLAGPLIALAAGKGWKTMMADAKHHRSVNAGYPEAAMAGALGIRLSGPRAYDGGITEEPWIGEGSDAAPAEIATALGIYTCACGLLFLLVIVGAVMMGIPH
ncbi:MAG: cobalamin biosynthesis protein CobD [Rhodospirillaceae bacterium]|jgi:adenosylcobinamide-phosphate synthase|nr:cobalamin biosynthesis protein CobD [Rhodospirillaceae bacterium]MBT5455549.1 cobalamin biosynthesis protein CobD [Rhodospirillaceae bacterium]